MQQRKLFLLKNLIECYIDTADPVGSRTLLSKSKLEVSPATIRNDMAYLESIGLIYQPHTSSGRIPTTKGFRVFVDKLMDEYSEQKLEKEMAISDYQNLKISELDMRIRSAVSIISKLTKQVSFATLPWRNEAYYLGIANVLRSDVFSNNLEASTIIEVLEDHDRFVEVLTHLPLSREIKAFIGDENAIDGVNSCTMIVTTYQRDELHGAMGILGSTRMRYAYNIKLIEKMRQDIES